MRHHRRGRKLGRDAAHRDALMMNMAAQLIEHGRIRTTLPKAKELRPYVEKLVTVARRGDLHARRTVMAKLHMADKASARRRGGKTVVQRLFEDVAPRFMDRPGGYTRIVKLGFRPGDAAPIAFIEFVDHVPTPRSEAVAADAHSHEHHAHA